MTVGLLYARLLIRHAHSLKEKRRVVKSIKTRIRNKFNVSVAEVADQDVWQTASIGVAAVGADRATLDGLLAQGLRLLGTDREAELIDHQIRLEAVDGGFTGR